MPEIRRNFASIWFVVVAVARDPGERLVPLALAANDAHFGSLKEIGVPKLRSIGRPPYPTGPQALVVTIDAVGVAGCHLALGWRVPERIIDLMLEFRTLTNGRRPLVGGLAGALLWFGRPIEGAYESDASPSDMRRTLQAVMELFAAMRSSIDIGRALLRGRYLCAVASIDTTGVPVDRRGIERMANDWPATRIQVIAAVDQAFGVFDGTRFDHGRFALWLRRQDIDWPRTASGQLDLGDDAFRDMARAHPHTRPLKELRATLAAFDPGALTIGRDCRNRTSLRPFASRTGRNQPSAKASVLGAAAWVRHFIEPDPDTALIMIDWAQQEFGIAAALSEDTAMQESYRSGDPYLALAIGAGGAPPDATAATHPQVRERFKACALGIQYGMGVNRLAKLTGSSELDAAKLQNAHRAAFPQFWDWMAAVDTQAWLRRELKTVFGWRVAVDANANPRSIRNFPMQANGAEMLRLACCLTTEGGIKVCAALHDALLLEAPLSEVDDVVDRAQRLMAEASSVVLGGFALRTTVRVVRAPDRWNDSRGQAVWAAIQTILDRDSRPVHRRDTTCSPASPRPILLSDLY